MSIEEKFSNVRLSKNYQNDNLKSANQKSPDDSN